MKSLEIRTGDEALERALRVWWREFSPSCPDGRWMITDVDCFAPLGISREITISGRSGKAALLRPFSYEELETLFVLRTGEKTDEERLVFLEKTVLLDGRPLKLSPLERRLLRLLWDAEEPLSARQLSLALWGEERSSNQVNVYISYLRRKTGSRGSAPLIYTARGKGFYIEHG